MNVITVLLTLDGGALGMLLFTFVVMLIIDVDMAIMFSGVVIILFCDGPVVVTITSTGR